MVTSTLGTRLLTYLRERVFVFTLLWIGFILAISVMATPLKFQAPSLTLPVAMEISYLLFHALNAVEIGLAVVITAITLLTPWLRQVRQFTLLIGALLAMQTLLIYAVLDARTLAIINNTAVPDAPYHLIYVVLEGGKLLLLLYLTHLQINRYTAQMQSRE